MHCFYAFDCPLRCMKGAEALHRSPPPSNCTVVLLDDVVEILHPPELAINGQDLLLDGGSERFRILGVLVRADYEGKSPMVGPHYLPEEALRRRNITLGAEHEFNCLPG